MSTCPHCGAGLRDNARFCPACMTSLVNKQVVPTPQYALKRWLSATAAVLVLCAAVGAAWVAQTQHRDGVPAVTPPAATTDTTTGAGTDTTTATTATEADTTTGTGVESTTITTLAETFGDDPTTTTNNTWRPTYDTTGRVPPFLTTTRGSVTTARPTTTTTTTKKTTTTTAATRPYWENVTPAAVTEDGLPIEEVNWTYEPISSGQLSLPQYYKDFPDTRYGTITVTKTHSGVPLNQCIMVTGFDAPTSNGIYRVPAMIDGKVVAAVDFGDSFADNEVALAAKRIYLPPDMVALKGGISTCTNLERVYVTSPKAWFKPSTFPYRVPNWWGGNPVYYLTVYVPSEFYPTYLWNFSPPVWTYACNGHCYDVQQGWILPEDCTQLYGGGDV